MAEIFASIMTAGGGVTLGAYLISLGLALLCGLIVLLATSVRNRISKSFAITVFLLPAIVHTVIIMVNGNIGTGIAVAGAFSLVRFRSVPVLFTALISVIMLVFSLIPIKREREYELHITVPESLNYYGAFDSVFKEYTRSVKLVKSKTSNMGSLYKLTYIVDLKNPADSKNMIDSLRERNGNLEIALNIAPEENEL